MKKLISSIITLFMVMGFTGCNSATDSSKEEFSKGATSAPTEATKETVEETTESHETSNAEEQTKSESESPSFNNAMDLTTYISENCGGSDVSELMFKLIGAQDGASFKYKNKEYEIYLFDDESIIKDCSDGSFTFNVSGIGENTAFTTVNGHFIMMCYDEQGDASVISYFSNLTLK